MATTIFQPMALFSIIQVAQKTSLKHIQTLVVLGLHQLETNAKWGIHKKNWKFITDLICNKFPISKGIVYMDL